MKKIFIASDHAGYNLKNSVISKFSKLQKIIDLGPVSRNSVDYPDFAKKQVNDCIKTLDQIRSKSSSSDEAASILGKYLVS